MSLKHFTRETFEKELNGGADAGGFLGGVVRPCRMLGPVIEGLADEYEAGPSHWQGERGRGGELAMRYGVMNIPTVILFKNGREIGPQRWADARRGVHPGAGRVCKKPKRAHHPVRARFIHASGEARSRSSPRKGVVGQKGQEADHLPAPHRRGPGPGRRFRDTGSEKWKTAPSRPVRDRDRRHVSRSPLVSVPWD